MHIELGDKLAWSFAGIPYAVVRSGIGFYRRMLNQQVTRDIWHHRH
jgi:hypothetical protein